MYPKHQYLVRIYLCLFFAILSSRTKHLFQVDPAAFDLLVECIAEGDFDKCEEVPAGDGAGFLIQPIGGLAVDMAGPTRYHS